MARISNRVAMQIFRDNNILELSDGSIMNINNGETFFQCECGKIFSMKYPDANEAECPYCHMNYFAEATRQYAADIFESLYDARRDQDADLPEYEYEPSDNEEALDELYDLGVMVDDEGNLSEFPCLFSAHEYDDELDKLVICKVCNQPNWTSNCYYLEEEGDPLDGMMICPFMGCERAGTMRSLTKDDARMILDWRNRTHSGIF